MFSRWHAQGVPSTFVRYGKAIWRFVRTGIHQSLRNLLRHFPVFRRTAVAASTIECHSFVLAVGRRRHVRFGHESNYCNLRLPEWLGRIESKGCLFIASNLVHSGLLTC